MSFSFTEPNGYAYKQGMIFLGLDPATGREIGIQTERHLFTAAGSRSGKGACLIIPNLKRWPHAVLGIDPKGENAEATWRDREAMGQTAAALDPFGEADLPDHVRASFNPLDMIHADGPRSREQVMALADGMIVVHDPLHMEWVAGARAVIAGVIAFVIDDAPPERRNLASVREVLLQEKESLYADAQRMLDCTACGSLAKAAARTIMKGLETDKGTPHQFLHKAVEETAWLDAPQIAACLSRSSFDLGDLKTGKLSLFLILPPDDIVTYSAFFRMVVKSALKVMMTGGTKAKGECLFILDEFFSLGRLDLVEEASGRMPGYGVHLWPFVQQIGQLQKLYGKEGSETFLGNSDALIFFNPQDSLTLEYISHRIGRFKPRELAELPPDAPVRAHAEQWVIEKEIASTVESQYATQMSHYFDAMRLSGTPRLTPSEITALTGKGNNEKVARSMIVFAKAGDILNLHLSPYFEDKLTLAITPSKSSERLSEYTVRQTIAVYRYALLKRIFDPRDFSILYDGIKIFLLWHWLAYCGLIIISASAVGYTFGFGAVADVGILKFITSTFSTFMILALFVSVPAFLLHHFLSARYLYYSILIKEAEADNAHELVAQYNNSMRIKWWQNLFMSV